MGKANLQRMAMFMIFLVMTLPMYTSSVFAQSTRIMSITGADEADGYRKANDYTKIVAEIVPAPGESFTASSGRVKFLPSGYPRTFSSCEDGDGGVVRCTWTSSETWTTESLGGGEYRYEVYAKPLRSMCEGIAGCLQTASIKVDEAPARVVSIGATPRASNGGIVTVAYQVVDTLGEGASGCSGIGSLQVDYDGTTVHTEEVEGSDCTVSGTIEINTAESTNGNNTLCIFVADKLGQTDTSPEASCIFVPKDDTEPTVLEFEVRDPLGNAALGFTKPGGAHASVYAIVQTSTLFGPRDRVVRASLASVKDDIVLRCEPYDPGEGESAESGERLPSEGTYFDVEAGGGRIAFQDGSWVKILPDGTSEMMPDDNQRQLTRQWNKLDTPYEWKDASGRPIPDAQRIGSYVPSSDSIGLSEDELTVGPVPGMWKCKSPPFLIDLPDTATLELSLTIVDEAGNTHTSAKTLDFRVDNDLPLVEEIFSQATVNESSYLGATDNTISVLITEVGSGFASNNVRIQIGSVTKPAECGGVDDVTWICQVDGVSALGSSGSTVTVSVTGADDSGQALTGDSSVQMKIDKEAPVLMYVEVMNIGETNRYKPFFTTGDSILVRAHIKDLAGMQADGSETNGARMDATRVSGMGALVPAGQCEIPEDEDHWVCEWQLSGLRTGELELRFQLADMLGNKGRLTELTKTFHMTIMEGDERFRTIPGKTIEILESDEESGDFWSLTKPLKPSPPRVDKTTAGLFTHTVWYELQLSAAGNIKPASVYMDVTLCEGDDVVDYMDSAYVISPDPDGELHYLKILLKRVEFDTNLLNFDCQLEVISIKDGKVTAPQFINFTASVPLFAEEDVSERLNDHIQSEIDGFISDTEFIKYLNMIVKILQGLCNIVFLIQSVADVLNTVAMITSVCRGTVCEPVWTAMDFLNELFQDLVNEPVWKDIKNDFCGYITCRTTLWGDWQTTANDAFSGALSGLGETDEGVSIWSGGTEQQRAEREAPEGRNTSVSLLGGAQLFPNPTNSLIMSIATGCIPGVVVNIQKLRNMRCKYLDCLINYVPAGMPLSSCSEAYSYSMCMWIWGEIFNIIPGAQFVQQLQGQIFDSISSWTGIIGTVVGLVCNILGGTGQPLDEVCRIITMPSRVVEIVQQIEGMIDPAYWGFDEADLCTGVIEQWEEENAESDDDDENGSPSSPDAPPTDDEPPGDGV